jgi:hypothetical protein
MPFAATDGLCRSLFIILGWVAFSLLAYKVSTTNIDNKIYDPFEILGIKSVSLRGLTICFWVPGCRGLSTQYWCCTILYLTSHSSVEFFGKGDQVSLQKTLQNIVCSVSLFFVHGVLTTYSHPDKVKLTGNDTAESVSAHFVDITKAYKAYEVIFLNLPDLTRL